MRIGIGFRLINSMFSIVLSIIIVLIRALFLGRSKAEPV